MFLLLNLVIADGALDPEDLSEMIHNGGDGQLSAMKQFVTAPSADRLIARETSIPQTNDFH